MLADGMPARFAEQDGITVDLAQVYHVLRHGVEIRNRSSMKRLHKNRCNVLNSREISIETSTDVHFVFFSARHLTGLFPCFLAFFSTVCVVRICLFFSSTSL